MSDDLVKRLREDRSVKTDRLEAADAIEHYHASHEAMTQEIERLTRERDKWREISAMEDAPASDAARAKDTAQLMRDERVRLRGDIIYLRTMVERLTRERDEQKETAEYLLKLEQEWIDYNNQLAEDWKKEHARAEAANRKVEKLREALLRLSKYGNETAKRISRAALAEPEKGK